MEIAQTEAMTVVLTSILEEICVEMGWKYGEVWVPEEDVLVPHPAAYIDSPELTFFRTESEKFTFRLGSGLPGRVWLSQEPEWIENVSEEPAIYYRYYLAKPAGLKAAVGMPIVEAGEVKMVMVFYNDRLQPANPTLIASLNSRIQSLVDRVASNK